MKRFYIDKVWIDDTCLWIETKDGRKVCTPFSKWKRLENATKAQRDDFILGYTGIHWPSLDEDLGYEGLFVDAGLCEATPEECSVVCEPLKNGSWGLSLQYIGSLFRTNEPVPMISVTDIENQFSDVSYWLRLHVRRDDGGRCCGRCRRGVPPCSGSP